ncbi:MAG TPA: hypothetical protein VLC98_14420 [Phnomibacter sp.]|nr:hypothetical protein [Phnomibacter sp.]
MKERLYSALNIKFSESSQVFDLLTVQFFIGLANALISIIALTLFIYSFKIEVLPIVYLTVAAALILLNVIYEKLEHIFSPLQLLKYVISFCILLSLVLWFGLVLGHKQTFIFILMVASILIYMLTGYAFWGLVSLLFNVRESRRVFSVVGSGDIPAKLIGYMAVPLFIPLVGITNLLWMAMLCLGTGLLLFHKYIKKKSWDPIRIKSHDEQHQHHHEEDIFTKKDFVSFFFKNRLIFVISLLSILSYNVFILIDFTFISQVKLRYENISDLATYIAVFFGLGRVIALAFKLIFTSRVIERLGVVSSLFITPLALLVFCLCFFFFGDQSNFNFYAFGLMAMITEVLRSTMQEPVFFILFQPLKESLRLKGHIISKGYMYPPSLIVVGLTLFLFYKYKIEPDILLSIKIVISNLVIWAGIIFLIKITYLRTIHDSIKKGTFNSDDIYINDQATVDILLKKVEDGKKMEVIYALNILEKSGYDQLDALLQKQLKSESDPAVKQYAIERLEALGVTHVPALKTLLQQEQDLELKQKYASFLCRHDVDFLKESTNNLHAFETPVRKAIIVQLLNQREFEYLYKAGSEITRLLHSTEAAERELAVEIISELKHVLFSDAIQMLMNDEESSVRRSAISTACKLRMTALLPNIIDLLDQPAQKNLALKGLLLYGDKLFDDIKTMPPALINEHLPELVKIASKQKGMYSTMFLLQLVNSEASDLKETIVHALWSKEYEPSSAAETETFENLLHYHIHSAQLKLNDYFKIPEFMDKELVKSSLFNEIKSDLTIALKITVLLFGKKEVNRILELLEMNKHEKLYNAMEMIDMVLPKKISKDLNALFDFVLDPRQNKEYHQQEINEFFYKAVFNEPAMYNPWTRSVCVYSSWRNSETAFLQKLKTQNLSGEHFLIKETKDYVLNMTK